MFLLTGFTLTLTGDDHVQVFSNNEIVLSHTDPATTSSIILPNSCVLAVRGENTAGGDAEGIIASTSTGIVTDGTWKCSSTEEAGWESFGFDDSGWPAARIVAANSEAFPNIGANANFIWTQSLTEPVAYCRKVVCSSK